MEDAKILLTLDELKSLKDLQNELNVFTFQLGDTEFQLKEIEKIKSQIIEKIGESKQKQQQLGTQLSQKYGNGTIDIESGEFVKAS